MNNIITSKEEIVSASKIIAEKGGIKSVNIRAIAKKCNVSVGTIYYYFPSKADLVAAVVGSVWGDIFCEKSTSELPLGFIEYIRWLYGRIQKGSDNYPSFFTSHSMGFDTEDLAKGRRAMDKYFVHMKDEILQRLTQDTHAKKDIFNENVSQSEFIDFIFSNIIMMSTKKEKSCDLLIEIIKRIVY